MKKRVPISLWEKPPTMGDGIQAFYRRVGRIIREARLAHGWSRTTLASFAGLARFNIEELEYGSTRGPGYSKSSSLETFIILCKLLGLKLKDLVPIKKRRVKKMPRTDDRIRSEIIRDEVLALHNSGMGINKIAKKLHASSHTIMCILDPGKRERLREYKRQTYRRNPKVSLDRHRRQREKVKAKKMRIARELTET